MSKTALIIALIMPTAAFAAIPAVARTSPSAQIHSASVAGADGARLSEQLSMGPDPGGKTGATVTPTTTGQPSAAGTGASSPPGASGAAATGTASDKTDPSTGPTSGAQTLKQDRDSSGKQPVGATGTAPTSSSTSRPTR